MLHPGLHGYLVDQHRRELERTAEHERALVEAQQTAADIPSAAERMLLNTGRLLIGFGLHLCARHPAEPQRALLQAASRDVALSPLSPWTPATLARVANATETASPMSFVYYGFVTVGSHGITRAEYVTPLVHPVVGGRLDAGKRG